MLSVHNLWDIKKTVEKLAASVLGLIDETMNMIDS